MKTLITSLVALGLLASAASARTVFDDINETAPRSVFDQLNQTAPKGIFDQLNETAPKGVFDQLNESAPRSDGVFGTLKNSAP